MSEHSSKARRVTATLLSLALGAFGVFNTGSTLAAKNSTDTSSETAGSSQEIGQLIVAGSVTVNDKRAITGTTVFTESRIAVACAKGSSALINLGRLGRIDLAAGSKLVLRFSDGLIGGDLIEGKAVVSTPAGVKVALNTPDGVSSADGADAAVTPVVTQRGVRCVPVATSGSGSSSSVIGSQALGAILVGIGGGVAAAAAVASVQEESFTTPPL
ncbi:MAG TPA: hypothetical protein VJ810_01675 [Blastocatellia bacterium]|nr:hypothetical protein [Blastocatellia bacterium]